MDANPNIPDLDYLGPADSDLPWGDNTFDQVRAVDVLEHIGYRHTQRVLKEWHRVMKPGALIYVQVPDARTAMQMFISNRRSLSVPPHVKLDGPPKLAALAWRLMGGQDDGDFVQEGDDWRWNAHYNLFDAESLTWHLEHAGFRVRSIQTNAFPNLCCNATKLHQS